MRTNANCRRQVYRVRTKIIAPIEILDQKKEKEEKRKEGNVIGPIVIVADHHRHSSDHLDLRCQWKAGYYPYPYQDKRKAG